jgi:aubergine-like protein
MPTASWDVKSEQLFKPVQLTDWSLVYPPRSDNEVDNFLQVLLEVSSPLGVAYTEPEYIETRTEQIDSYRRALLSISSTTTFVLVVLPSDSKPLYDTVKQILCLDKAIPSQCVIRKTIANPKGLQSRATKISVQIASKMGGSPWTLSKFTFNGPTMVVGLDVYHSGEIVRKTKASVVGFTASMNSHMAAYYSRVVIQNPGQEIVEALGPCLESALQQFHKINKVYPKHIIFYRDGVGEGQVADVIDKEVKGCLKCLKTLGIDAKLCFLVVLKRIHTRLFAHIGDSLLANPPPGTVVDTDITGPDALEFFLVSQSVNQGTATPTRYQCIFNESKFNADYLQKLTYQVIYSSMSLTFT